MQALGPLDLSIRPRQQVVVDLGGVAPRRATSAASCARIGARAQDLDQAMSARRTDAASARRGRCPDGVRPVLERIDEHRGRHRRGASGCVASAEIAAARTTGDGSARKRRSSSGGTRSGHAGSRAESRRTVVVRRGVRAATRSARPDGCRPGRPRGPLRLRRAPRETDRRRAAATRSRSSARRSPARPSIVTASRRVCRSGVAERDRQRVADVGTVERGRQPRPALEHLLARAPSGAPSAGCPRSAGGCR